MSYLLHLLKELCNEKFAVGNVPAFRVMPVKHAIVFAASAMCLSFGLLVSVARPAVASASHPRTTILTLPDFGYPTDLSLSGPSPHFAFSLPVYSPLRALHLHMPIEVSPVVDARATITVKINEETVFSKMIGTNHHQILNLDIPIPKGAHTATITIDGVLFRRNDVCGQLDNKSLWMRVSRTSTLALTVDPHEPRSIADFFNTYGGRMNVVLRAGLRERERYAGIGLAYALHLSSHWRTLTITSSTRVVRGVPNVVFVPSGNTLELHGTKLYVSADSFPPLIAQIQRLLLTTSLKGASAAAKSEQGRENVSLRDLGIPSQTVSGQDEMPVTVPLSLGQLGGVPTGATLHLDMTHTSLAGNDRGELRLYLNGTLVNGFNLSRAGGLEHFDIPIDPRFFESVNTLHITPTFYSEHPCRGATPMMTASVLDSSSLSWDGAEKETPSIRDFFASASGRVAVLLEDQPLADDAFALLDKIGSTNTTITHIDVLKYTGAIPAGYDYAIILTSLENLSALNVPFKGSRNGFELTDPSNNRILYRANAAKPFAVMQTSRNETPALVVSYWKDHAVLHALRRLPAATFADAEGNVVLFNDTAVEYKAGYVQRTPPAPSHPYQRLFRWFFLALGVGVVVALLYVVWRRRAVA